MEFDPPSNQALGAALEVHRACGPELPKSVYEQALALIHDAQLLTYLKLSGVKTGLLINFNVPPLKQGIKRLAL